ncbi:glycosyl transferase family 2 [Pyrolobus fumarii 1A]|uniref:Dolichol-phosphate mannosyltransferase n=1 Tax=Pyrolobus fumarii (strain DSM 11204 / 1A) TaxID=694429 RepID=G0EDP4_PYRF1|nr:glycosyl transferase family 2 [Pyrolobus fumarii 1A]
MVIPTYNERENIPVLLERLEAALRSLEGCYEAIIIDDDSPDGTWKLAQELASARYPWLRVVRRIGERGLGSAIVRGLREARGKYVVVIDADLQHPPELIPKLLETALKEDADVVIASRYVRGGGVEGWSWLRRLVSLGAGMIARLLLPEVRKVRDPMSGFWLVRKSLVEGVSLEPRSWKILLEILVKAKPGRVVEVPYVFHERLHGKSKLKPRHMLEYLLHLLHLSEYRVFKFALVGASGTIVNLATLAALVENKLLPLWAAYLASFETSLTWNYILHDTFTFRGARPRGFPNALRYWLRYHKAALGGLAAYYTVSMTLSSILHVNYLVAGFLGILTGFAVNFLVSQHHVWNTAGASSGDRVIRPGPHGGP